MSGPTPSSGSPEVHVPELTLSADTVCWFIAKFREFDVKDAPTEQDPGSNASDDNMASVLEDQPDDPVVEEIDSAIASMSVDQQADLVALMWLGRDGNSLADWASARAEAARARGGHPKQAASYLLGEPMVSDYLEEGLSIFGLSCEGVESV